ncbi:MAG: HAMP domain-containing histidine kinase [Clostridia bacterium]|nr:HAMP domain-containing histidine kinase [Clostridia bacterium]
MTVNVGSSTRVVNRLAKVINGFLANCRNREIETNNKDAEIRETITNMSHDVRTPLTSLKGYFELMCESDSEEDKERYKTIISERLESLSDMLEDMFLFTKINNASFKLENERVNVSEVLIKTVLSYIDEFEKHQMVPDIDIDENIFIVSDENALKRVFQNLIKNSLVHGKDNFSLSLKTVGKKARIRIANDISGDMPDTDRVFDRFYKGDKSRHVNSSGIGLSVTKKLVNLTDATITASIENKQFCITIEDDIIAPNT